MDQVGLVVAGVGDEGLGGSIVSGVEAWLSMNVVCERDVLPQPFTGLVMCLYQCQ